MEIHNTLPLLLECLGRWESRPKRKQFLEEFAHPMRRYAGDFFDGFDRFLSEMDWAQYRAEAITLDPAREEARLRRHLQEVESLLGVRLEGEVLLMGGFGAMDGYARFDRGSHRVFLGVDESHARGRYLDVLITHELTHVARESRPEVWLGLGLDPKMTQDEFTENQPVIEHLMGEGFSCVVSEILVPGEPPWTYAYQDRDSWSKIRADSQRIGRGVLAELRKPGGDYGKLYRIAPELAHYVWAWQWVKSLLKHHGGGDPRKILARCSADFMEDALRFELNLPD